MKTHLNFYPLAVLKIFLLVIFSSRVINAQDNPFKFSLGEYNFKAVYDTSNYQSVLTVNRKGNIIYTASFIGRIDSIHADNLGKSGGTNVFIDNYTGGAHCCFNVYIGFVADGNFGLTDSLDLQNSGYVIKDLNEDNLREIVTADNTFAYAFTNYAQSRFSPVVYTVENNKFVDVTRNFPNVINASISELKSELKTYTNPGFTCPDYDTTDTFNTDAGAVKALLAPIVTDYYNLGEVQNGYNFVDSVYRCPDKDKFIRILQNDYKLK